MSDRGKLGMKQRIGNEISLPIRCTAHSMRRAELPIAPVSATFFRDLGSSIPRCYRCSFLEDFGAADTCP
jgi:hypothetical protein